MEKKRIGLGAIVATVILGFLAACGDAGPASLGTGRADLATVNGYSFEVIAELDTPAPRGGNFINDFEIEGINTKGDVFFGTDLACGEGLFLARKGVVTAAAICGDAAPGGGTFQVGFLQSGMNAQGDAAFSFLLNPAAAPFGRDSGAYFLGANDASPTAIVVPHVTAEPGGGTFEGVAAAWRTSINNMGQIVFNGMIDTPRGIHVPGEADTGLGVGVFLASPSGGISSVVSPGDGAPGGGSFDYAASPVINARGDVAFEAHRSDDECVADAPQAALIGCSTVGVFLSDALRGELVALARPGDAAPGGGTFRDAGAPMLNNRGDVLFAGDLTVAPDIFADVGLYLYSARGTAPLVRRGDALPGGGTVLRVTANAGFFDLNESGDVAFRARLADPGAPFGVYATRRGKLQVVARAAGASGAATVLPGIGTVRSLSQARLNERGQVATEVALTDGRIVLVVATPLN